MKTKFLSLFILVIVLLVVMGLLRMVGDALPKPTESVTQNPPIGSDIGNDAGDNGAIGGPGPITGEQVFCTMDAKICPDGSAVGRVGPRCEFSPCPGASGSSGQEIRLETTIGQSASGLGVKITPLEVVEESRCPSDVVCIQAGTIRVRTALESGLGTAPQVFELNKPITTETEIVTMVDAQPYPRSASPIRGSDYRFTFSVKKR